MDTIYSDCEDGNEDGRDDLTGLVIGDVQLSWLRRKFSFKFVIIFSFSDTHIISLSWSSSSLSESRLWEHSQEF